MATINLPYNQSYFFDPAHLKLTAGEQVYVVGAVGNVPGSWGSNLKQVASYTPSSSSDPDPSFTVEILRADGSQYMLNVKLNISAARYTGSGLMDEIFGTSGADTLRGYGGDDTLRAGAGNDKLYGGADNDDLYGGTGNDFLDSNTGNDRAWGEAGDDQIYGGTGNDSLDGGTGNDRLNGNAGNDILYGRAGNDRLWGEDGNDKFDGGAGTNTLSGGAGNDIFYFKDSGAINTASGGSGKDTYVISDKVTGTLHITGYNEVDDGFLGYSDAFLKANATHTTNGETIVIDTDSGAGVSNFTIYLDGGFHFA